MALTVFGKAVRKARVDADVTLSDMAVAVGVSPALLSGLETGRTKVSKEMVRKVECYFRDLGQPVAGLGEAADVSNQTVSLEGLSLQHQMMVSGFARISDAEALEQFRRLLDDISK